MVEYWKDLVDYENNYCISNYGNIESKRTGLYIKPMNVNGYRWVKLSLNGKVNSHYIHILVARTFIGKRPKNKEINHKDGDKWNCRLDNLEYVTQSENTIHALKNNLIPTGELHHQSKLKFKDVLFIRKNFVSGKKKHKFGLNNLSKMFGVCPSTIHRALTKRTWRYEKTYS